MRFFYSFLSLILIGGCQAITWKSVAPHVSQKVQANDGLEVAFIMQNHEENLSAQTDPSHILAASRNFEHQIFVQEGNPPRAITGKRPFQDEPGSLYYLKTQGYLIVGSRVNHTLRYDKIDLATGRERLISDQKSPDQLSLCKHQRTQAFVVERVIPSQDGLWIAHFYSLSCFEARVEFLDAHTLKVKDRQTIPIQEVNEVRWKGEGWELYSVMTLHGWKLNPYQAPVPLTLPLTLFLSHWRRHETIYAGTHSEWICGPFLG